LINGLGKHLFASGEAIEDVVQPMLDQNPWCSRHRKIVSNGMLSDAQLAEMWLRQVDTSTAGFLKQKFRYQAAHDGPEER